MRGQEAVGAILECPKCGCLVPVLPPEGWQPPKLPDNPAEQSQQPPQPLEEGPGDGISSPNTVATTTSAVGAKAIFYRLWHSWFFISVAPVVAVAIGIVVWQTMFSKSGSDNSAAPTVTQSSDVSAKVSDSSDKNDVNPQTPEQAATLEKNDSTTTAALNPDKKSDTQPAAEDSIDTKPQPGSEPSEAKTTEEKVPEHKTPEADTPEVKTSTDEKTHLTEAESPQNNESASKTLETSKLVKLVAPEEIDVQSRLADVVPNIEFREMPFARAIGLAASLSGLPITIDPEAMALLQVSLRDPITLRLSNATVEEVLQAIVAKRGMAFVAEEGRILVTGPAEQREKLRGVRYTVSDLAGNDNAATNQLAVLIQKFVAPESWREAGGQGTIEADKTALVVEQTGAVHDQILAFCEKLRNARGRPLKSNRDPKQFELTTRLQKTDVALNRRLSANFRQPATLVDILAYLGQQAEVDILLDRQALAAAGMSDKSEIAFAVDNRPLAAALNDLLPPLKLGYRPIDAHTLQVTTKSALAAYLELEFYPIGKTPGKDLGGSDLVERIKTTVSPASWNKADSFSAIYFDQSSGALIVLQSPPVQETLQVFLHKTMENKK